MDDIGAQMEFYPYNDPSQLPILPLRDQEGEWLKVEVDYRERIADNARTPVLLSQWRRSLEDL